MRTYQEEFLQHYGVLGMKWGQRRAEKRGETYKYTSWNTKRHANAAAKLRSKASLAKSTERKSKLLAKADVRSRKAKASQAYDTKQQNYAKNKAKVGTSIVGDILTYPGMRNSYQRMRANGGSKVGSAILAGLFGDAAGRMSKHKYIKKHSQK